MLAVVMWVMWAMGGLGGLVGLVSDEGGAVALFIHPFEQKAERGSPLGSIDACIHQPGAQLGPRAVCAAAGGIPRALVGARSKARGPLSLKTRRGMFAAASRCLFPPEPKHGFGGRVRT